ncbi:MAG: hypothetical protein NTU45_01935 [Planctomycetota bacterium]|nr:hypothetical protein [Planctomycetota bacterium]
MDPRDGGRVAEPCRDFVLRESIDEVRLGAGTEVLEEARPRLDAGALQDLLEPRPQVLRGREDAREDLLLRRIRSGLQVCEDLSQPRRDRNEPLLLTLVMLRLRAPDGQRALVPVDVAPAEARELRRGAQAGETAEPDDRAPLLVRARGEHLLDRLDRDMVRTLRIRLRAGLEVPERTLGDHLPPHRLREERTGDLHPLRDGRRREPGVGERLAPPIGLGGRDAVERGVLPKHRLQPGEGLLVGPHRAVLHDAGFAVAPEDLADGRHGRLRVDEAGILELLAARRWQLLDPRNQLGRVGRPDGPMLDQLLDSDLEGLRGLLGHLAEPDRLALPAGKAEEDPPFSVLVV